MPANRATESRPGAPESRAGEISGLQLPERMGHVRALRSVRGGLLEGLRGTPGRGCERVEMNRVTDTAERKLIEEVMWWYAEAPNFLPISVQHKCDALRQERDYGRGMRSPSRKAGSVDKQGQPPVRLRPASLPPTK